jgi:hypothetical protein
VDIIQPVLRIILGDEIIKEYKAILLFTLIANAFAIGQVFIDFEILGAGGDDGPTYLGTNTYAEGGYTLTTNGEFGFKRYSQTDSIVLFSRWGNDIITLTKSDELPFDLVSIDYLHVGPEPIEFLGVRSNGATVDYTKNLDLDNTYSTIVFSDFTNLVSVSWQGGSGYNHFDNITIIPEPSTLCLFALGAVLLKRIR